MSTLVVEVCEVKSVKPHPNADRLAIATVKAWETCIRYDPNTKTAEFNPGDKCIYFPPDCILPPELANSPHKVCKTKNCKNYNTVNDDCKDGICLSCGETLKFMDGTPGRLGVMSYCAELPKKADGTCASGGRVKATRLRGCPSYGFIMKIDETKGDDPYWSIGQDVKDHFKVKKWEPPPEKCNDGDADRQHLRFHEYTKIENYNNFPEIFTEGEEVVFTEKIHGKNCRMGIILDTNKKGEAVWIPMCGSHAVRRKKHSLRKIKRTLWKSVLDYLRYGLKFKKPPKYHVGPISEFWVHLTPKIQTMLLWLKDNPPIKEESIFSVILFGEIFGRGVQDMAYGQDKRGLRCFDIAINRKYIDFDLKEKILKQFDVEMVPIIYRGPFTREILKEHVDGPTTMCEKKFAGEFSGREGVVITPVKERQSKIGRVILKAISADYLARKNPTDGN